MQALWRFSANLVLSRSYVGMRRAAAIKNVLVAIGFAVAIVAIVRGFEGVHTAFHD